MKLKIIVFIILSMVALTLFSCGSDDTASGPTSLFTLKGATS